MQVFQTFFVFLLLIALGGQPHIIFSVFQCFVEKILILFYVYVYYITQKLFLFIFCMYFAVHSLKNKIMVRLQEKSNFYESFLEGRDHLFLFF